MDAGADTLPKEITTMDVLQPWLEVLVPQPCYDEFFVKFNFLHAVCLKIVISKCLGFGIILGSVMVKVPQVMKIVSSRSGEGVSIISVSLELLAITASLAYNFSQGYPFTAWGEALFLSIQTAMIAILVLIYSDHMLAAASYSIWYTVITTFLMTPSAPTELLWILQACVIPVTVIARVLQVFANFRAGHTGQLSAITILLLFVGALARVFTSIQETGDPIIVATYVVSTVCNALLAFQMIYYWNVTSVVQEKSKSQ